MVPWRAWSRFLSTFYKCEACGWGDLGGRGLANFGFQCIAIAHDSELLLHVAALSWACRDSYFTDRGSSSFSFHWRYFALTWTSSTVVFPTCHESSSLTGVSFSTPHNVRLVDGAGPFWHVYPYLTDSGNQESSSVSERRPVLLTM